MRQSKHWLWVTALGMASSAVAQVSVTVTPATATLYIGNQQGFAARVTGAGSGAVTWAVNGVAGGNATVGTIAGNGRYTPPAALPRPNVVQVSATSVASPAAAASAAVTLLHPFPALASVAPPGIAAGTFRLTLNGSSFVSGAQVSFGRATVTGVSYVSPTRLTVSGRTAEGEKGWLPVVVQNPEPGAQSSNAVWVEVGGQGGPPRVSAATAARFLEQAAFGPDAYSVARVQQLGLEGYLEDQFDTPASPYQDPRAIGLGLGPLQARFYSNAVHGADQLRQRVAFALGQIWVVSGTEANVPEKLVPYLKILQKNAFGNFRTLMREITLDPGMGEYLDMVNNGKGNPAQGILANENYAREILQLFSVGLFLLNQDGTLQLDSQGQPFPTYSQATITEFARVFSGWTYPTRPGQRLQARNPAYFGAPMEPWEANHDTGAKTLLNGVRLPAGQTAEQDLNAALDNIFYHANVGPFVVKNLIQHLVTSNPSPAYVERVARVFWNDGRGERGDLKAVVRAILLDPEARRGDVSGAAGETDGHLREPALFVSALLRALGAQVNDTNTLTARVAVLGQNVLIPPTVFNYYTPLHQISRTTLLGPEFQIHNPTTATERSNLVNAIVYGSLAPGVVLDLTSWTNLAAAPEQLLDTLDATLLHGTMPRRMRQILLEAVNATPGARAKAQAAIYLLASSQYYSVEH